MNKKESFLKTDLLLEQSVEGQKEQSKDIPKEKLTQSDLAELYKFADKKIEEIGDRVDDGKADVDGEEILELKQELSDLSSDEQKVMEEDFNRLNELSAKSRQVLEKLKKGAKKMVAIGILLASFSSPAFASESQADEITSQQKIERRLEVGELKIRDLRPGMIVDRKELKKCLREASRNELNEWIISIAQEKGKNEQRGQIIEVREGGSSSLYYDAGLILSSFIEGKKIESIHTHPKSNVEKETEKTNSIKPGKTVLRFPEPSPEEIEEIILPVQYDPENFAFPPSFGDISSLYFSKEFFKESGFGMTNNRLFVEEPSGEWEYGIKDENNLLMKRFSDFIKSWHDKRDERGRKMEMSQEELKLMDNFYEEINKNKDINNEYVRTLVLFFEAKAMEIEDEQIESQCLGIANKAKQISKEARQDALSESGVTQEDIDLIDEVERLTQDIYGYQDAETASPKKKAQRIEELKKCYEKFGIFLEYTKSEKE